MSETNLEEGTSPRKLCGLSASLFPSLFSKRKSRSRTAKTPPLAEEESSELSDDHDLEEGEQDKHRLIGGMGGESGDSQNQNANAHRLWKLSSHPRPTYCNVCSEQLHGITSHGLSCEICKFKSHKVCLEKVKGECKWTTLASMKVKDDDHHDISMQHQWVEGNLPMKARCRVCGRGCGSVLKLQDYRCLWCFSAVHAHCVNRMDKICEPRFISVIPPILLRSVVDGSWLPTRPFLGCSPLIVFVNSKSGDQQGLKLLTKFRRLLNPAQVFDLVDSGPCQGLKLFKNFSPFRILVCGGDGSVGWVLTGIDTYNLHNDCQIGILPLGTGNDLARVLGWGASFAHDAGLPHMLERYEKGTTRMLDRWSVQIYEPPKESETDGSSIPLRIQHQHLIKCCNQFLLRLEQLQQTDTLEAVIDPCKRLLGIVHELQQRDATNGENGTEKKLTKLEQSLKTFLERLDEHQKTPQDDVVESNGNAHNGMAEEQFEVVRTQFTYLKEIIDDTLEHIQILESSPINTEDFDDQMHSVFFPLEEMQQTTIGLPAPLNVNGESSGSSGNISPMDFSSNLCLPVPGRKCSNVSSNSSIPPDMELEDEVVEHGEEQNVDADPNENENQTLRGSRKCPKIEIESPSSYSPCEDTDRSLRDFSRRVSIGSTLRPTDIQIPEVSEANSSSSAQSSPTKSESEHRKRKFPIVNPCIPHFMAGCDSGGFVEKMLLQNTDTVCAVASPLMSRKAQSEEEISLEFNEKVVMNNYFGVGIDAKITLDFHMKREEHPEKLSSRARNFVWYGLLGGKEYLQQTCKNLNRRIQLICDGHRIRLPTLQGIVVLNIQSFMGGTNFWGGTKEDSIFVAPSYDDRVLEVVAVFDTMQMAASRVVRLRHHRLLQCRSVTITVLGEEPVPIQVDGEAWLQSPGVIRIVHKNRVQMLCRNKGLETSLRSWRKKVQHTSSTSPILNEDSTTMMSQTPEEEEESKSAASSKEDIPGPSCKEL